MQTLKTTGIVTAANGYGENGKMLTIVSPEYGKLYAIARGCQKSSSRLLECVQPFCCSTMIFNVKNNRLSLTQATALESFYPLRSDVVRLSCANCVLYLLMLGAPENQPCERLFKLASYSISYICYGIAPPVDIMLCFLLKFLDIQGFSPATTTCAVCGSSTFAAPSFDFSRGALCKKCSSVVQRAELAPVLPLTLEAARRMLRLDAEEMDKVRLPDEVREELLSLGASYACYHLDSPLKPLYFAADMYNHHKGECK